MLVLIWLGGPAVVGALLALVTRVRSDRSYILLGVGLALAIGYVLLVYLNAPPDYQHSQGDEDGKMLWGRWWEPQFTSLVAVVGFVFWALGTAAGLLTRGVFDALFRERRLHSRN